MKHIKRFWFSFSLKVKFFICLQDFTNQSFLNAVCILMEYYKKFCCSVYKKKALQRFNYIKKLYKKQLYKKPIKVPLRDRQESSNR